MTESAQLKKLLQQKARIEERLKQQQRMEAEKERKRDTRRKVITGAIVEEYTDMELAAQVAALLKQHVKERDRHLFPELFPPANDAEETGSLKREFHKQDGGKS